MSKSIDPTVLNSFRTHTGITLGELCAERPLLLVFLRHFG